MVVAHLHGESVEDSEIGGTERHGGVGGVCGVFARRDIRAASTTETKMAHSVWKGCEDEESEKCDGEGGSEQRGLLHVDLPSAFTGIVHP